ncbi:MAG: fibronectin type III domain-containing protein [Acidobacteria bacterium]|nr:fibronectin type III domain-containing protein [Acidobacteriota bacterium]
MTRLVRASAFILAVAAIAAACSGTRSNPAAPSARAGSSGGAFAVAASAASPAVVEWSCLTTPGCVPSTGADRAPGILALVAPESPSNLAASVSGSTVTLTWTASHIGRPDDAPTSYRLEAGLSSGASDIAKADTGSVATTYIATGVPSGTYYVRVRAVNGGGFSAASNEAVVVVGSGVCAPAAPSGLQVFYALTAGAFSLNWTAPVGGTCTPTSYEIDAGSSPGSSDLAAFNIGHLITTYAATGIADGTYYVRVRAARGGALSAASNEVVVTLPHNTTTTTTSGPLSGGWSGSPPNAGWSIDGSTGACVVNRAVILQLTQAGSAVSGTLLEQFTILSRPGCATQGASYTFALTGTAGTAVNGNGTLTFSFTDEQGALITFTGTYTPTSISGTLQGPGTPAGTLLVNKS